MRAGMTETWLPGLRLAEGTGPHPRAPLPTQQSAERCVSTLLDLIQTKVNYVVQEAIVVIKDIFRKYPNKYVPGPSP